MSDTRKQRRRSTPIDYLRFVLTICVVLASMTAKAEQPPTGRTGSPKPGFRCPCQMLQPLPAERRPSPGLELPPEQRRVTVESTISRSGVWDGAVLLGEGQELETRLWWQNLTAKDYDSVSFQSGAGRGAYARLDSQPSAYGVTFRLSF